ncbi:MAG: hypothetical protein HWQ35_32525 [Nostoc sp. NMS1]|uniref:hypothetical protein n=1 Tax=unclassified Nostoc TaxID=2593658 RepID=UPI0025F24659|nr:MULTISPECIES: hypothetical protein [unclassified Nostoc]MBN3911099.1 hypothetical protein [Nostoc sp. NMS1]MBN3990032.1 hypothetical protein [Nostoc sp. NMS2]
MTTIKSVIGVTVPQAGFVVTLEGTSLFLGILLSTFALIGIGVKVVSKFNTITNEIRDLREDLNTHANSEGHEKLLKEVELLQKDVIAFDKRFDVHLQDYTNYKDANLLQNNNLNEKINHTWNKTEKVFIEHKTDIKDLQQFLQKQENFRIRE